VRAALEAVFRAAVRGCDPKAVVRAEVAAMRRDGAARVRMIAAGKAAVAMAWGAVEALGDTIVEGLVVHPEGAAAAPTGLDVRAAAHPVPDARSEAAGRAALALAARAGADEILLVLVSGGASSLMVVPRAGMNLAEKANELAAIARRGASIAVLNRARIARSAIKGGQLAATTGAARVVTLVASDVPGNDPAIVGSGPTVPGRAGDLVRVVAGLGRLRAEAAAAARASGYDVVVCDDDLVGTLDEVAARALAGLGSLAPGGLWVGGGEWTVALDGGVTGEGGRASELALVLARALRGRPGVVALVGASDGVDGTGPGAGAVVDGTTWDAIADAAAALADHDSGRALASVGAALAGGPTGVNHADLVMIATSRES